MALRFFLERQTFDAQGRNLIGHFFGQLAFQINKIFVFFNQLLFQLTFRYTSQLRQLHQLFMARQLIHRRRNGIQRFSRGTQSQRGTVAVGNRTARSRQGQCTHKAAVALVFQEGVLAGLDVDTAENQRRKRQSQAAQHQHHTLVAAARLFTFGLLGQHLRFVFVFN